MASDEHKSGSYHLFMLALCLFALAMLAVETVVELSAATQQILKYADFAVCVVFFADFVISLLRSPSRWRYFRTWGWIDLISSIPAVRVLRWGRLARVLRVLRILRGVRATRIISTFILARRAQSGLFAAALLTILFVVFGSIAVLHFEQVPEANIKSPQDALWWACATITTVGYGDRFPTTTEGRFVGLMLMVVGVGLFGILAGFVASWFIEPSHRRENSDMILLREELSQLRKSVDALRSPSS
ncbi:MAG: ion transporter [Candidatus Krumholzibacteriia bacterium]